MRWWRNWGWSGAVDFLGFREDVPELMRGLDILVHASVIGEPFGQVVAEGMAAGCAVVATRGGGVPEIVVDGESGLLVEMGDAAGMAAAIGRLCGGCGIAAADGGGGPEADCGAFYD